MFGRERLAAMVAELSPDEDADALLEFVIATADEASDDMAVFVLRPLAGAEVSAPRVETVELEAEDSTSAFRSAFSQRVRSPARMRPSRSRRHAPPRRAAAAR